MHIDRRIDGFAQGRYKYREHGDVLSIRNSEPTVAGSNQRADMVEMTFLAHSKEAGIPNFQMSPSNCTDSPKTGKYKKSEL